MPLTHASESRLLIQHAMTDHAIYHSAKIGIRVDRFRATSIYGPLDPNILPLRTRRAPARKKPILKIPLPANDNLVPLG